MEHLVFGRVGSFRSDSGQGQGWTLTGSVVYEQTSDWPDVLMLFLKKKIIYLGAVSASFDAEREAGCSLADLVLLSGNLSICDARMG